jgi:hypothetical protein
MNEDPAPLIEPTPVLELGRSPTNPRFLLIGFAVAAFLHIYAVILLPNVLDIEFDADPVVEIHLINEEIDNDPDVLTNYNVDRIEEVLIPGRINPADSGDTIWVPNPPSPGFTGPGHARRVIIYTR